MAIGSASRIHFSGEDYCILYRLNPIILTKILESRKMNLKEKSTNMNFNTQFTFLLYTIIICFC